jgi:tRNA(Ile)-lysidine synthase
MTLYQTIENYITQHNLLQHNSTIIIGLSGGPDSVFLFHLLVSFQKKYNLTLIAVHLNHEWRPEADDEEKSCALLAKQYDIFFVSAKLSALKETHKYNGSKEEFARAMRRHFLENVAREHNGDCIALGHHAQDQQETFFIRLIRSTSLAGLTSMRPRHGLYIRPLLQTNKADILACLHENKITYATDSSNHSADYLRNRIRLGVIPALQECDARWNGNFLATITRLQQDDELLNDSAHKAIEDILKKVDDVEVFDIKQFLAIHPLLYPRVIMSWLIKNNVKFPVSQGFLEEIIRFLSHERGGTHVIHREWCLIKKQGLARIKRGKG